MNISTITYEAVNKSSTLANTSATSSLYVSLGEIEQQVKHLSIDSFNKNKSLIKKRKSKGNTNAQFFNSAIYKNDLAPILHEIQKDLHYYTYQIRRKKAEEINRTNFICKQFELTIMNTTQIKKKKRMNRNDLKNKITKENWNKMRRDIIKKKDLKKDIFYEEELSSSDSYDSDLNPLSHLTKKEIEKRMNEIKKAKFTKGMVVMNDMKNIYEVYDIITN